MEDKTSFAPGFSDHNYRALRLTFLYKGANVQLISQQSVEMMPPAPESTPLQKGQSGFWYELQDKSGRILYQRSMHNPIQFEVTVHSDESGITMTEKPIENPEGVFEILAPDIDEAQTLVLYSSPLDARLAASPAKELGRFDLARKLD